MRTATYGVGRMQRKLQSATSAARQSMNAFRENRKTMGFVQTSAYIPVSKKATFSLIVKQMQAEYMLELLDRPYNDAAKIAMAQCNYQSLPDHSEINQVITELQDPVVTAICKEIISHIEAFNTARNGLRLIQHSEEEVVTFAALAVAHNTMAAYMWEALIQQLNVTPPEVKENAEQPG